MKVNYKVKRNRILSIIIVIPIALIAIAEFLTILSSRASSGYFITQLENVEIMSEIAVAILIIAYVLSFHIKGKIFSIIFDVVRFVAVALLCVCVYIVLDERANLMGYIWFSDLEANNEYAVNALNLGVAAAVVYVVSIVLLAVSSVIEFVNAGAVQRSYEEVEGEIRELQAELASIDNKRSHNAQ